MNALVPVPSYHAQLPAFLRDPSLFAESDKTTSGIGGSTPPYISIKGSKFALVDAAGETFYVQQMHLDVIVLTGNEHISKTFYAGAYDPGAAAQPPDCWSDNGIGPSSQASVPQCVTCAACKNNVWGSKVTPSGSQVKLCTDSKKLAVVLAADTQLLTESNAAMTAPKLQQVYLLRVPAASMGGWRDYARSISGRGVPIIGVHTRITFNPKESYPALLFKAEAFVASEADFNACRAKVGSMEVINAVGSADRPTTQAPAPVMAPAPAAPAPVAPPAPTPAPAAVAPAPAQAPRPRGRPAAAPAPAPVAAPIAAAAPLFPPASTGTAIQEAQASSPDLDALLSQTLG